MDSMSMAHAIDGLAHQIYVQAAQATAQKSQCQRLAERVSLVHTAFQGALKQGTYDTGFQDLVKLFEECLALIKKFF